MQYSIQDFLQAQIDGHIYSHAHPDLQTYFTRKARAFRAAFRMPLDAHGVNRANSTLRMLFQSSLSSYIAIRTPFSNYLEVNREHMAIYEQYGPEFEQQAEHLRVLHRRFMLNLLEKWYSSLTTTVLSEDLLHHGFDDTASAPDPADYI